MAAKKTWMLASAKAAAIPAEVKATVSDMAQKVVASKLIPAHVKPPPKSERLNYLVDISVRWRGRYFYFVSTYACPGRNAISPRFELPFARMEYQPNGRFKLAYMRHTGAWWETKRDLTAEEAMIAVGQAGNFQP